MKLVPRNSLLGFDSIFNDFFSGFGHLPASTTNSDSLAGMRVDVHDAEKQYEINAELPGVKKKDISIELDDGVLTVSATKSTETEKKEKDKVIWKERSSGYISRSFMVGKNVQEKDINARFTDGVLTLTVPKKKEAKALGKITKIPIK